MALDEPAHELIKIGFGKRQARSLVNLLRDDVAPVVWRDLPGVEHSGAAAVLIDALPGLRMVLPDATEILLGLDSGSLDTARSLQSILLIRYLDSVIRELLNRAKADPAPDGRLVTDPSRRPMPGEILQHFRHTYAADLAAGAVGLPPIPASTIVGDQLQNAIARIPDRSSHAMAKEWTGWALLAAMHGINTHRDKIPILLTRRVSPFDPVSPQLAFRAALMLLIGGALSLIA